ncbi:MAG: hypothetical protein J6Q03_00240 [Paludibacteraceae bacterium]|nr:hypothetical protein [Paludibacteraceae bacterium]
MQEGEASPVTWNEEEEMFVPVEGVKVVDEKNITEYLTSNPADFIPPEDFNEASFKNVLTIHNTTGKRKTYIVETPLARPYKWIVLRDYQLEDKLKEKNSNWQDRTIFKALIKPTLENPRMAILDDKGLVFVKPFTNYDGKPILFCVTLVFDTYNYVSSCHPKKLKDIIKKANSGNVLYPYGWEESRTAPSFNATVRTNKPFKVVEICLPFSGKDILNVSNNQTFNEKNSLGAPGDTYIITDTRTRARKDLEDTAALKKYDIRKFSGEELQKMQTDDPLLYEQIKSDLQQQKTPIKPKVKTKEDWMQEVDKMLEVWKDEAFYKTRPQKLDEPGSRVKARYISNLRDIIIKYFIEEIDKGNYDRVSNIANILGYKYADNERISQTNGLISQFVGIVPTLPEGWRISKNIPKWLPKLPKGFVYIDNGKEMFDYRHKIMPTQKGLGKTANDALYNNNELMDCRGLKPTYKILQSYDAFFAPAQHSQTFAGVGLDDTKKLIADICKAHYKDCARIAQHLKADTKLQSVFNLWHWLRHNIRYEYDREGREEVRTPLRTWADRRRGVDCDCLSVFAWCVLKCMGYDPAFELVCFKGKKQPSHILVNLDGIRCDRVWFVFNSLPPGVSNSEIYRVTDRATAAQLAGLFN